MSAIPNRFDYALDPKPLPPATAASQLKLVMFDRAAAEMASTSLGVCRSLERGSIGWTPTPELFEELSAASSRLETGDAEEIIAWGVEHYAPYLTMATAFGPEGCVILAMLAKIAPETYVFNLDTGYQFQETLGPARPNRGKVRHRGRSAHAGAVGAGIRGPAWRPAVPHESESVLFRSQDQNACSGRRK